MHCGHEGSIPPGVVLDYLPCDALETYFLPHLVADLPQVVAAGRGDGEGSGSLAAPLAASSLSWHECRSWDRLPEDLSR